MGKGTIVIRNIGELATPVGAVASRGSAMKELRVVQDAVVAARGGRIIYAGPAAGAPRTDHDCEAVDARGRTVVPGFVDSHTHFVFGGFRDDEFAWRASGVPYMEIHERGGGIGRSVGATRKASLEKLVDTGRERLKRALSLGVTTMEGKSGYGLDLDTELRQLEAMRILGDEDIVRLVPTFMGLHATPKEYAGRTREYVDFVIGTVLPEVKRQGVAVFCDVFTERNVFELDDSRRYLEACAREGFGLKLHADEIERIGGAGLAAEMKAVSADHLLKASPGDIARMAAAGVVATCLPLTAFVLREPYADARSMIDSGCALALASDLNPGSCYSQSIPMIFAIGVLYMKLSVEECLTALTLNGAAALGLAGDSGSLEPGKRADLLILDAPGRAHLAYHSGMNLVETVVRNGTVAFRR
ncbi:MAG: imidazolonepropionase [Spirochaetes bacterium]|nr:imidazolonepropionase [Spirochaetota bacterium]